MGKLRHLLLLVVLTGLIATIPAASAQGDMDCGDFDFQEDAQEFFEDEGGPAQDPHDLDRNNDGVACEDLPRRGSTTDTGGGTVPDTTGPRAPRTPRPPRLPGTRLADPAPVASTVPSVATDRLPTTGRPTKQAAAIGLGFLVSGLIMVASSRRQHAKPVTVVRKAVPVPRDEVPRWGDEPLIGW